jgi:hypothetical protein
VGFGRRLGDGEAERPRSHKQISVQQHRNRLHGDIEQFEEAHGRHADASVVRPVSAKRLLESDLTLKQRKNLRSQLPLLRQSASTATDALVEVALGAKRRKLHKGGMNTMPGRTVRYRTYQGSISPKPNAFVVGKLDNSYGPLLENLVKAIARETEGKKTDRDVAKMFSKELGGADAFTAFPLEIQQIAHKIIAIILFAELSRHSLNLVSAAATFHAVASRPKTSSRPGLVASFRTGSNELRPLFAGKGGARLSRGELSKDMSADAAAQREVLAVLDLHNYFLVGKRDGEAIDAFIERKTREIIEALSTHAAPGD